MVAVTPWWVRCVRVAGALRYCYACTRANPSCHRWNMQCVRRCSPEVLAPLWARQRLTCAPIAGMFAPIESFSVHQTFLYIYSDYIDWTRKLYEQDGHCRSLQVSPVVLPHRVHHQPPLGSDHVSNVDALLRFGNTYLPLPLPCIQRWTKHSSHKTNRPS